MVQLLAGKKYWLPDIANIRIRPLARARFITGLHTWGILQALSAMSLLLPLNDERLTDGSGYPTPRMQASMHTDTSNNLFLFAYVCCLD